MTQKDRKILIAALLLSATWTAAVFASDETEKSLSAAHHPKDASHDPQVQADDGEGKGTKTIQRTADDAKKAGDKVAAEGQRTADHIQKAADKVTKLFGKKKSEE